MSTDHAHGPSSFVTRHVRLALLKLSGAAAFVWPASRQTLAVLLAATIMRTATEASRLRSRLSRSAGTARKREPSTTKSKRRRG